MVRKANPAFLVPKELTPALEAVVGKGPMPFPDVMTNVWAYIKKHNLQNPQNKRNIIADEKLLAVFDGKKEITMFEMTKLLYKNTK
jgi:chromatin remodeling complex protein RSC6